MCIPEKKLFFWQDNNKRKSIIKRQESLTFEIYGDEADATTVEGKARSKRFKIQLLRK